MFCVASTLTSEKLLLPPGTMPCGALQGHCTHQQLDDASVLLQMQASRLAWFQTHLHQTQSKPEQRYEFLSLDFPSI